MSAVWQGGLTIYAIAIHSDVEGLIFAAAQDGASLSRDGGLHWFGITDLRHCGELDS
jgi:hypothetical protein